jgi:DNA polymerase-3 subunit epsilon
VNRVLILDLETTGLSPETDRIVEVGMVLYSLAHASVVCSTSFLVNGGIGNDAASINRIAPPMLTAHGETYEHAFSEIHRWMTGADVVVAHNAEFDRSFLAPNLQRALPWVCTYADVDWPTGRAGTLVALSLELGLGVTQAHRALTDCMMIARCLQRVAELGHDVTAMLERGLRPKALYQAVVSYDNREQAKAAGFRWEGSSKRWLRQIAVEDAHALPFQVREVAL